MCKSELECGVSVVFHVKLQPVTYPGRWAELATGQLGCSQLLSALSLRRRIHVVLMWRSRSRHLVMLPVKSMEQDRDEVETNLDEP